MDNNTEARVLDFVREHGAVSTSELATHLEVTRQTAHRYVTELTAEGTLIRGGAGRGTRYRLAPILQLPDIATELDEEASNTNYFQLVGATIRHRISDPGDPLVSVAWAFDYMTLRRSDERYDQFGPYGPMMENADGMYPPLLSEVPPAAAALWASLCELVSHPYVKARLHDLLWQVRWSDRPDLHAEAAIDAYLELSSVSSGLEFADGLARAGDISLSISDSDRRQRVALAAQDRADEEMDSDAPKPGIVLGLLEPVAATAGEGSRLRLSAQLNRARDLFADPWIQEQVIDQQRALALGDEAATRSLRQELVEVWRTAATGATGMKRMFFLNNALDLARRFQLNETAEELRREVREVEFVEGDRQSISTEVSLPRAEFDRIIHHVASGDSWAACLARLAGLGPLSGDFRQNVEAVKQQADQFPFQHIFPSHVIGPRNETIFIATSDEEKQELGLSQFEGVAISIQSYNVAEAIERVLAQHGDPTKAELQSFFTSATVDVAMAERFAAGLGHFLHGRFDEAVLVLLPRIEAAFRNMVDRSGGPLWWEPATGGRYGRVRPLGQLLRQLRPFIAESWLRYFETALVNALGPNLRNTYLHGLVDRGSREHAAILIHIAVVVALMVSHDGEVTGETN